MEGYGRIMLTSSISAVKVRLLGGWVFCWIVRVYGSWQLLIWSRAFLVLLSMLLLKPLCRVWPSVLRWISVRTTSLLTVLLLVVSKLICMLICRLSISPVVTRWVLQQVDEALSKWSSVGRPGEVQDVAGVASLIASSESQWLRQTWQVSGGAYMV